MARLWITSLVLLALGSSVCADVTLKDRTSVVFATVEQGQRILGRSDDFVQRMSPFDRAARLRTSQDVSQEQFLEFVARNVLPWQESESRMLETELEKVNSGMSELTLDLPRTIYLVKTTGREEGGAAYTRDNAVVVPQHLIRSTAIQQVLAHELFHILTRNNPRLGRTLYEVVGFKECTEVEFPPVLKRRKITNPDAPRNNHFIRVSVNGEAVSVVPILYSRAPRYDVGAGGELFDYLEFRLLVVKDVIAGRCVPVLDESSPRLVEVEQVSGFYEQVGRNTSYIIHPEEILAENFGFLVLGKTNIRSPWILERLRHALSN